MEEHNECLNAVFMRLQDSGITLNQEKCCFSQSQVKLFGQVLSPSSVHLNPEKVTAIFQMKEPTSMSEVHQFLGMTNQLSKTKMVSP